MFDSGEGNRLGQLILKVARLPAWAQAALITLSAALLALAVDQLVHSTLVSLNVSPEHLSELNTAGTAIAVAVPLASVFALLIRQLERGRRRLQQSEERLGELADTSSDWFWETDEKHRFSKIHNSKDTATSLENTLLGKVRWSKATHHDLADTAKWDAHRQDLENFKPFRNLEYEVDREPPIWMRVSGNPVFDDNGVFKGYVGTASDITKEMETSRRLEEQGRLLSAAINSMSSGFAIWNHDDRLVMCNEQFRDLYPEIKALIVPGAKFVDLTQAVLDQGAIPEASDSPDPWLTNKVMERRIKGGSQIYKKSDGRWIQAVDQRTPDGGSVSERTDITKMMEASEALRHSEERFALAFHQNPQICAITTLEEGIYVDINKAFEQQTGFSRSETIGRTTQQLGIWPDKTFRARFIHELKENGRVDNLVGQMQRKDKEKRLVRISASTIEIDGQQCLLGVFPDVTDEITAARALEESEKNFKNIVETASAPIVVVNRRNQIMEWNEAAAAMTGYAREEVHYCIFTSELIPDYFSEEARLLFAKALAGQNVGSSEVPINTRDGGEAIVLFSLTPQMDHSENIVGLIAVGQDVTALKQAQEQLFHTQKLDSIGYLSGGIAHDFNNLLQVVGGAITMIDSLKEMPDEQEMWIRKIEETVERGGNLTSQLLAFSRQQALSPKPVKPADVLFGIDSLLKRTLGEDISFSVTCDPQLPAIFADAHQLQNAIINLCINARDAMPSGGELKIEASEIFLEDGWSDGKENLPAGQYISLKVSDTGKGMDPELIEKAFDPFFTTKEVGKGTGLGLSMVYGFARQSGGLASLESTPGVGTTVSLLFPEAETDVATEERVEIAHTEMAHDATLLLVEDDPDVRQITSSLVKLLGYRVIEAESGEEALNILSKDSTIDVVFSDIVMPGNTSGFDLARKLLGVEGAPRIVLASGYPEKLDEIHDDIDGRVRILSKPFNLSQIREVLSDAND